MYAHTNLTHTHIQNMLINTFIPQLFIESLINNKECS